MNFDISLLDDDIIIDDGGLVNPPEFIDDADYNIVHGDTRNIEVHANNTVLEVASDENAKRIYFKCEGMVTSGFYSNDCNFYINYRNANGELNSYLVDDVTLSGDIVYFSWLLSRHVLVEPGTVNYIVCVKRFDGAEVVMEWNTVPASGTVLANGIEPVKEIEEHSYDIIEQIISRISKLEALHADE